jgi:hypothetical protein
MACTCESLSTTSLLSDIVHLGQHQTVYLFGAPLIGITVRTGTTTLLIALHRQSLPYNACCAFCCAEWCATATPYRVTFWTAGHSVFTAVGCRSSGSRSCAKPIRRFARDPEAETGEHRALMAKIKAADKEYAESASPRRGIFRRTPFAFLRPWIRHCWKPVSLLVQSSNQPKCRA